MSTRAAPAADGIAEIRRLAAKSVLESLQTALDTIDEQSRRIHALRGAITKDRNDIHRASGYLTIDLSNLKEKIRLAYGDDALRTNPEIGDSLQSAEEHLENLTTALNHARETVKRLAVRYVDSNRLEERKDRFRTEGAIALRNVINRDPLKELRLIWEEGLDLLSGLCLRNEGLDGGGLCRFADAIISEIRWTGINIKAMSVPGRGGPGHFTSIIHLWFPEWTVWALPLMAHELWCLGRRNAAYPDPGIGSLEGNRILDGILETLSRTDPEAKEELHASRKDWGNPELQSCLGDVFGVHVMGPAYACAAIWLVLNPEESESKQRALSILHALRSSPKNAYDDTCRKLEAQWRQANKDGGVGEIRYTLWIDALLKYLEENASPFYLERWREVRQPWTDALKQGGDVHALDVKATDLRYAVTAAWKTRMEWPDQAPVIATNCFQLCEKILTHKSIQTVPGLL